MIKKISIFLISLSFLFVLPNCANQSFLNPSTPDGKQTINDSIELVSYFAFKEFLRSKDREEGILLATQISKTATLFLKINPEKEDIVKGITNLVFDINENYPIELRKVAEKITNAIKSQINTQPIDKHYYLVRAAATGALDASNEYIQYGFGIK